ncbi:MAG TPA: 4-hydroxy-tetrahydrodipicolinate reductase, partial [Kofleriaceae bacterium]
AAVSRSRAGQRVGEAVAGTSANIAISATVAEALDGCDVLVDYTSAVAVKGHVLSAIERGVHVVIGSSGLTDGEYDELDGRARRGGVGLFAAGNFAITAVLLQRFAEQAARVVGSWEIIDYGGASKPDAPSGTARELAARLEKVRAPVVARPVADTVGEVAARGATVGGMQVHSMRLPGFVSSIEVVFGSAGERLSLRHDSVDASAPYVAGTLLAIRRVGGWKGLVRGLDHILDG